MSIKPNTPIIIKPAILTMVKLSDSHFLAADKIETLAETLYGCGCWYGTAYEATVKGVDVHCLVLQGCHCIDAGRVDDGAHERAALVVVATVGEREVVGLVGAVVEDDVLGQCAAGVLPEEHIVTAVGAHLCHCHARPLCSEEHRTVFAGLPCPYVGTAPRCFQIAERSLLPCSADRQVAGFTACAAATFGSVARAAVVGEVAVARDVLYV